MSDKKPINPLIFIKSQKTDYQTPPGKRMKIPKMFEDFNSLEHRERLQADLQSIQNTFATDFELYAGVPCVAKMILHDDAIAKTHRPTALLAKADARVIGANDFGEILVSLFPETIERLVDLIGEAKTKEVQANLTAIKQVTPLSFKDISSFGDKDLLSKKVIENDGIVKYRLFDYRDQVENGAAEKYLKKIVGSWDNSTIKEHFYSPTHKIYEIHAASSAQVDFLLEYLGTRSVGTFARFDLLRYNALPLRKVIVSEFPKPNLTTRYPLVGVVDSGINPTDPCLAPWVERTHKYVNNPVQDYSHGSFVSGLIVNAHNLNHQDRRFEIEPAKIVDVCALDSNGIQENELKAILEEVVPANPDVKVWNLSLSSNTPCEDYQFSDLAVFLDSLQEKYGISIVLSAGNYVKQNMRGWPAENLGESDRITTPGDSVRAITVGSTAHTFVANSCVKSEEPSPFSRRGPGPAFLPKPELSHYGGNCTRVSTYQQTGVISLNGQGDVAEDIGTSFSAPPVSALIANVRERLGSLDSRSLAHALVIHSAILRSKSISAEEFRYRGFGIPGNVDEILACFDHQATSIFEVEVVPGIDFVKDFPIPPSLRTAEGKTRGEFTVTLVYDPPLDSQFGAEYCRANVDVSLGRYGLGGDGKPHHEILIPLMPSSLDELYEKKRIEHGFKWSPIKIYSKVIPRGTKADNWRLKVSVMARAEHTQPLRQRAHVVITVADSEANPKIYTEFLAQAKSVGWNISEIRVNERARQRG